MKLRVIFTAVFFIFQLQGWAQLVLDAQVKLELSGTCMLDTKDVKGLAIHLYKSGKVIDTLQNQASFAFELDYKSNYRMVINKPGFQRKILAINTEHVSIKRRGACPHAPERPPSAHLLGLVAAPHGRANAAGRYPLHGPPSFAGRIRSLRQAYPRVPCVAHLQPQWEAMAATHRALQRPGSST